METIIPYVRYLIAVALAFFAVGGLSFLNDLISRFLWPQLTERFEVLGYSYAVAGPIAFAVSFLVFFFGLELLRTGTKFDRSAFWVSFGLAVVGVVVNIICLPRR